MFEHKKTTVSEIITNIYVGVLKTHNIQSKVYPKWEYRQSMTYINRIYD